MCGQNENVGKNTIESAEEVELDMNSATYGRADKWASHGDVTTSLTHYQTSQYGIMDRFSNISNTINFGFFEVNTNFQNIFFCSSLVLVPNSA